MNLRYSIFFSILISVASGGCAGREPFQPPPPEYKMWRKAGASDVDVKISLLECGYPDPFSSGKYSWGENEAVLADICMQADGFNFQSDREWRSVACPASLESRIPACGPGTKPPRRSVELRLGSPFCQKFPSADACQ